jgi:hypothetical protein
LERPGARQSQIVSFSSHQTQDGPLAVLPHHTE